MRILITGATGLLGSTLVYLWHKEHQIIAVSRKTINVGSHVQQIVTPDITTLHENDWGLILADYAPDWVVHCVAMTDHVKCQAEPMLALRVNSGVTQDIANACHATGVRMLYISTDSVFDGKKGNYTEGDFPNPVSTYGKTKLSGEQWLGPNDIIVRGSHYGWNASERQKKSIFQWAIDTLRRKEPIPGWTDVYFTPLSTMQVAGAIMDKIELGRPGLWHLASAERISKYEFIHEVADEFLSDPFWLQAVSVETYPHADLIPRDVSLIYSSHKGNWPWSWHPSLKDGLFGLRHFEQHDLGAFREMFA